MATACCTVGRNWLPASRVMPQPRGKPPTKLSQLKAAMRARHWQLALRIASRFPRLGEQRDAILSGHEAYVRPKFFKQLGRDVEAMKEAGRQALIERYGK